VIGAGAGVKKTSADGVDAGVDKTGSAIGVPRGACSIAGAGSATGDCSMAGAGISEGICSMTGAGIGTGDCSMAGVGTAGGVCVAASEGSAIENASGSTAVDSCKTVAIGAPHAEQNFPSSGIWDPHCIQNIYPPCLIAYNKNH